MVNDVKSWWINVPRLIVTILKCWFCYVSNTDTRISDHASPYVHTVPLHMRNMFFKNTFRLCKSYPSFSYLLTLKAPAAMENSERRHSASGKKIKCITERLHNKPQQGTQAPTDSGRRKFCVYSVTASCLRLPTTQLFMETHI